MKRTTAWMIAAGLVAVAGAALADQSVVVNGNLHTPAGDYPVEYQATGLPADKGGDVPAGQTADDANQALDEHGVPFELQMLDGGVRPNARCGLALPDEVKDLDGAQELNGVASGVCISDEPMVEYPRTGIITVGPDGVAITDWIAMDSGQALALLPDEALEALPEEQRAPIREASDSVSAAVEASVQDGASGDGLRGSIRVPGVGGEVSGRLDDPFAGQDIDSLLPSDGSEAWLSPDGVEAFFEGGDAPLPSDGYTGAGALEEQAQEAAGNAGGDLAAMAMTAALVGGALIAPAALYHRIRANHTLKNKTRQKVYDSVVTNPGVGVSDAAKAAGCSYSTAAYHLERLVQERLLVASEDGRRARFFKNGGAFSQVEREFVPVLQSNEAMNVLQVIVENPWCYRAEIAQKLGVSGPTVNWHLKRLMGVGAVKEMREGRISYLYADKKLLNEVGANLIGKVPEDLVDKLRFARRPELGVEMVEPAEDLPETSVPLVGAGEGLAMDEVELTPLPDQGGR